MRTTFAGLPGRALVTAAMTLALVSLAASPAFAQTTPSADAWHYSVTPYLWLPSVDASLRYGRPAAGGASPNVKVDANTLLGDLNFGLLISADARKGRWSIATDLMYMDLSGDKNAIKSVDFNPGPGPVNVLHTGIDAGTDVTIKATIWSLWGGYAVVQEPGATLDLIGGFRYANFDATTDWRIAATVTDPTGAVTFARTGSVSKSADLWDAIVGVRGRFKVGDGNWFVPYHVDVGGGDSRLTYQGVVGIGYSYKWGDLGLVYRYLHYDVNNKLIDNITMSGPTLGAMFRF